MTDYIDINIKVGDLVTRPGIKHIGTKDAMIIDYMYPELYPNGYSDHHLKTFAVVRVPKDPWESYLRDYMHGTVPNETTDIEKDLTFRDKGLYIPLKDLAVSVGSSDLVNKLRGSDIVPVLDLRNKTNPLELVKPTSELVFDKIIKDLNSISSGDWTIGTGGQDYATINAFKSDIITQTDNLSGDIETDITETTISLFSHSLNSYNCRLFSSTDHEGSVLNAIRVTCTYGSHFIAIWMGNGISGEFKIDNFEIYSTVVGTSNTALIAHGTGDTLNFTVDKMFVTSSGSNVQRGISFQAVSSALHKATRCACWDVGTGFMTYQPAANLQLENCIAYNNSIAGIDLNTRPTKVRNVWAFSNATDFLYNNGATGNNCASSDASATNGNWAAGGSNLPSLTPASEAFLDDTLDTFLRPKSGANIYNGGSTPVYTSDDMSDMAWAVPPPIGVLNVKSGLLTLALLGVGR